jgi:hypothetical protein
MASLDSSAFFHDLAHGANSDISAVIATLLTASIVNRFDRANSARNVMFALWNGESWGHLGSRRFVSDLTRFTCTEMRAPPTACLQPYYEEGIATFKSLQVNGVNGFAEIIQVSQIADMAVVGGNFQGYLHYETNVPTNLTKLLQNTVRITEIRIQFKSLFLFRILPI